MTTKRRNFAAQQIELMETLWKSMSEKKVNIEPPDWHLKYLKDRENAVAAGDDEFIDLDEFESELRSNLK